ncbi:MAG: AAA family ATPase [Alphaproteobacteria bacterium]
MAIQFARMEYVSRGSGNACLKSAYNQRSKIKDERSGKTYSFAARGGNIHSEVMLPKGVSSRFLSPSVLWNEVEKFETRKNSQLLKDLVLALPDNEEITLEDRVELCRRFIDQNFTSKGLGVQFDIHEPHHKQDKNWHAHLLITTRRFRSDGESLDSRKARDLDGIVRKGFVLEANRWGEIWRDLQNEYFKEKGLSVRVDTIGVVPQEHLGPVRMRSHMSEVLSRGEMRQAANIEASLDAGNILELLTKTSSTFTDQHVKGYLEKQVPESLRDKVRESLYGNANLVRLHDKSTGELTGLYTTKDVRFEEEQMMRLGERIERCSGVVVEEENSRSIVDRCTFSKEQEEAFRYVLDSRYGLRVIQGRAGTGKSYLLSGLRAVFESAGQKVFGLAPTGTVVRDLRAQGFDSSFTVHDFLFRYKNNRLNVEAGSVFIVDEAGMVGHGAFGELLKVVHQKGCKIILAGDDRQLSSVERGGMFKVFAEKFGAVELTAVRRQEVDWQRRVSEKLSQGNVQEAVGLLETQGRIYWANSKPESLSQLVEAYTASVMEDKTKSRLILAHSNLEVDILNQAIRRVMQAAGKVDSKEYLCETTRGEVLFAVGDRVQFTERDKHLGLTNGEFGNLIKASPQEFVVETDRGQTFRFDPRTYGGLRLGYAGTVYKGQGKTVDEAYVLHSPLMNQNLSYVSLTRQTQDVRLYVSQDETKDTHKLITQMSRSDHRITTLEFHTAREIERERKTQESAIQRLAYAVGDRVRSGIQHFTDRVPNASFYNLPAQSTAFEGHVSSQDALKRWEKEKLKEDKHVGESSLENEQTPSYTPQKTNSYDLDRIEGDLKKNVKSFALHLLGKPDSQYSTRTELCFKTSNGKTFVNTETGLWYDFKTSEGGNLFALIQRERGGEFKDSLAYAASYLGYGSDSLTSKPQELSQPIDSSVSDREIMAGNLKDIEKVKKAQSFYEKTQSVTGTLGEKYLQDHRSIQGPLPGDVRFINKIYNSETKTELPALVSFMRNKAGDITGYQTIYLDETGQKADLSIVKRSQGLLKGSFVEVQKGEGPVYLAEGLETALSLKESGLQGTILAGLGISNLKNYEGDIKDVIICADHDEVNSITHQTLEKTQHILQEKGYSVNTIYPKEEGRDFNDVLIQKGKEAVFEAFKQFHPEKVKSFRDRDAIQGRHETQKDLVEQNPSKDQRVVSLKDLEADYERKVSDIYKEKLGSAWTKYKAEIKEITAIAAKDSISVENPPKSLSDEVVLFAQNQHYVRRVPSIEQTLLDKDPSSSWMKVKIEAKYIAAIESRLYGAEREKSSIVSPATLQHVQEKALEKFGAVPDRINHYETQFKKEGITDPLQLHFLSRQAVMFEAKVGQVPTSHQLKAFKEASVLAAKNYQGHCKEHEEKLLEAGHNPTGNNRTLIDMVSKYCVHQEMDKISTHILDKGTPPSSKDLGSYVHESLKEFRISRDAYLKQEKEMKTQETQKTNEQRQSQIGRSMNGGMDI